MRAGFILLPLLICFAGCSGKTTEAPPETLVVETALVSAQAGPEQIFATGSVAARRELELGFTTAGQIATLSVNEGDRVQKGQLLAALNSDQVASALSAAQAEERRANAEYKRMAALNQQGWVTQSRVDNARAAYDAASAAVRAGRFAAQTSRIIAPSNGVVLARLAEPREVVAAGTPVVILGEDAGGHVLRVPLSDRESARVQLGTPATVTIEAIGQTLQGKVIEIGGRSDRATGAFQVEISLPDLPALRSGLIGRVTLMAAQQTETPVLTIPPAALFSARAGEGFVYVIDAGNRARLRKIMLGETTDGGSRVLAGIKAGERVATTGLERLQDGMPVSVSSAKP